MKNLLSAFVNVLALNYSAAEWICFGLIILAFVLVLANAVLFSVKRKGGKSSGSVKPADAAASAENDVKPEPAQEQPAEVAEVAEPEEEPVEEITEATEEEPAEVAEVAEPEEEPVEEITEATEEEPAEVAEVAEPEEEPFEEITEAAEEQPAEVAEVAEPEEEPVEEITEATEEEPAEVAEVAEPEEEPVEEVTEAAEEEPAEVAEVAEPEEEPVEEVTEAAEEQPAEVAKVAEPEEEPVTAVNVEETDDEGYVWQGGYRVKYNKSFTAKIIQSDADVKEWYNGIKNELLSYDKVRSRMSWRKESFNYRRSCIARIVVRGKTLCLYLDLDTAVYADTKYKVEEVSGPRGKQSLPCMYRIKNARRAKYAIDLIDDLMAKYGIERIEHNVEDYAMPYESTESLVEKGLIKRVLEEGEYEGNEEFDSQPSAVPEVAAEEETAVTEVEDTPEEVTEEPVSETAESAVQPEKTVVGIPVGGEDGDEIYIWQNGYKVRYNKSFTAKIIQADSVVQEWYSEIKNELLSYKRVRDRMSWRRESFSYRRRCIARLLIKGKTLCLCLALDAGDYAGTKYRVEEVRSRHDKSDTPCLYRIKNARRVKYAKQLIDALMTGLGIQRADREPVDYTLPHEDTQELVKRGLIKCVYADGVVPEELTENETATVIPEETINGDGDFENELEEVAEPESVSEESGIQELVEESEVSWLDNEEVIEDINIFGQGTEEPTEEVVEEVNEEPVEEVVEEVTEEPAEKVVEEVIDEPAEEVVEEVNEEPVEEVVEEVNEEPVEEVVEEVNDEPVEEVVEEVNEEPAEEVVEEVNEEPVEEVVEEVTDEPVEEVVEEVNEEPVEEVVEEVSDEPTEEVVEEVSDEPAEEVVEEVTEEPVEEVVEEVNEEPAEEVVEEIAVAEDADEDETEEDAGDETEEEDDSDDEEVSDSKAFEKYVKSNSVKNLEYYREIYKTLTADKKIVSKEYRKHESFRYGEKDVAKIAIAGKTLKVYLALNPKEIDAKKFKFRDVATETPVMVRIKNLRDLKKAKQLIGRMLSKLAKKH